MARVQYPDTLPELFERAFERGEGRPAVIRGDRTVSYATLDRTSAELAAGLREAGVGPGDTVAVSFANRVESPIVDAAIARTGAVRVPLNPTYTEREVAHVLRDAGVSTVVTDVDSAATLAAVADDFPEISNLFAFGDPPPQFDAVDSLRRGHDTPPSLDLDPTDRAAIYYTGGTTGDPKGVVYSHRVLVRNYVAHLAELDIGSVDVGLLTAPLSHSAGTFLWTALLSGSRTVIHDGFDVAAVAKAIREHAVTWTMLVPTMLYRVLEAGDATVERFRGLDRVYYGTAPVRPRKLEEAVERLGGNLVQFYGQTEVPNLITTFSASAHERAVETGDVDRLRSAGTAALQVAIKIVDLETGTELPPNEVGEVVVAAPYAFVEYHERPTVTAETRRDGWVHTGDIGRIDEDGYLTLLDRKANVVTTGGMNVYTREVESALATHSSVAEAAVIGIPDDEWGEAVHAIVVPADGASPSGSGLRAYVGERLASYKKPKSVEIRASLPRTALGKLDRERLRAEFWSDRDRSIH